MNNFTSTGSKPVSVVLPASSSEVNSFYCFKLTQELFQHPVQTSVQLFTSQSVRSDIKQSVHCVRSSNKPITQVHKPVFVLFSIILRRSKGMGKAIPLHAWTGPEGSRRLRLSDFKTIDT
jgi:hypothetical protein